MLSKGKFTISIDTELAWGTFDHGGHQTFKKAYQEERDCVDQLLSLFKKYNVSATWAVVGHLFLDHCDGQHADLKRPKYVWYKKDWFYSDPGTNIEKDPIWYGKDIVEKIRDAVPEQDIGSHSFSHLVFSDKGTSRATADSDLKKCVDLASDCGVSLKSFVFPRNAEGYLDVLSKHGFKVFRRNPDMNGAIGSKPSLLKRFWFLMVDMLPISPSVYEPEWNGRYQLAVIPASMQFRYGYGAACWIPPGVRFLKAKQGLKRAIQQGKVFHLWFHPFNFVWKKKKLLREFEAILRFASEMREQQKLEILSMADMLHQGGFLMAKKDIFNEEGVQLHNERAQNFREDYSDELVDYQRSAFTYGRRKITQDLDAMLSQLKPGARILDVGCGTGYFMNYVKLRGFYVEGIDKSEEMLTQLKRVYGNFDVQVADARSLSFSDNEFDAVISIETIRYFDDRHALLKEIERVLKPNGFAFITAAPIYSSNAYGFYNLFCQLLRCRKGVSCYQSFETKRSLKNRLQHAGFNQIDIAGHFFGPYFLLDKYVPKWSQRMIRRLEPIDDRLSKLPWLANVTNHLTAIAQKRSLSL